MSGAAERNEDVLYVCLDNEAYMNTGIQRSGCHAIRGLDHDHAGRHEGRGQEGVQEGPAWPSSPPTTRRTRRRCPSPTTTTSSGRWRRPRARTGFRFLHVMTPCVPGWRSDPSMTVEISRLAVETGMWTLYELEDGEARTTYKPQTMLPVTDYLKLQGRFRHMDNDDVAKLQEWLCRKWYLHYGGVEQPVCAKFEKVKPMKQQHEEQMHFI
ncbi:MAG: hypothetical protein MZV70_44565 [Desulfobacterales bacterium]|nr:hypothetical protein [Desulfobacterales bacterium]